jgi:hypothetical protein
MVQRQFESFTNGGSVVQAHRVTEDTAGNVETVDGSPRRVGPGDVLVRTQNSNRFVVASGKEFDKDYTSGDDVFDKDEDNSEFDPNTRTAVEVRNYLNDESIDVEERDRVREAEEAGKNRASALR